MKRFSRLLQGVSLLQVLQGLLGIGLLAMTPPPAHAQITNGLTVHLTFDNNYNDSSTNKINGTAVGNPKFVPGQIGQAVSVTTLKDGSEFDYVTLGYPDLLKFGSNVDFTISFWCNYTNQVDDPPFISNKNWSSSDNLGWGIFTQDGGNFRVNVTGDGGGTKQSTSSTPRVRDGAWHNVVVSFARSSSVNIYVDGALSLTNDLSQTTGTIDTDDQSFAVNIGQDGTGSYTDGGSAQMVGMMIDDLAVWRRVLGSDEVAKIFSNGTAGKSFDVELVSPPTIISQPLNQIHFAGVTVPLTIKATGVSNTYEWLLNGQSVAGATNSSLTLTNVQAAQGGTYTVIISNPGGSVTNQPFSLTVNPLSAGSPVTNALAAHLTFDGNYTDSSTNGVNGTAVGTPAFVPGVIGQAVSLTTLKDGSEFDYVSLGYPAGLNFSSNVDFTVSFWCNYTNQVDDPPFISNKNWSSSGNVGWGIFAQGGGNFRVNVTGDGGGKESTTATPNIRDGAWHHIAVSFKRTNSASIFVDGSLYFADDLTQVLGSIDTDPASFAVNVGQDGTGSYTDGGSAEMIGMQIDDLGIWRRVLTTQEIEYAYLQGRAGKSFDALPPAGPLSGQPTDLGQLVNGFQDDFTSASRKTNWVSVGPGGDNYVQTNGVLQVSSNHGDPNHLLYMGPGASNSVQEVLARLRIVAFGTGDPSRGGIAAGVITNLPGHLTDWSGINLQIRDNTQDNVPGRQFKFLDDLRAWGPAGLRTNIPPQTTPGWTNNVWYWMRLKMDGTNGVFGKVWTADATTPEPTDWQMTWAGSSLTKPLHSGYAGITGSSADGLSQFEVDYILIKAATLPSITVNFTPQGTVPTLPEFQSVVRQTNNLIVNWFGGYLQSSSTVTGMWADVANAANPKTNGINGAPLKFYRIRQ